MEPLDDAIRAQLRRVVFALRQAERGRSFGPVIHVGLPHGEYAAAPAAPATDHALRADVTARLLRWPPEEQACGVWLTRTGALLPHDLDPAWLAAARSAFAEAETELAWFVVVTKAGWLRPATGERAEWRRLRIR